MRFLVSLVLMISLVATATFAAEPAKTCGIYCSILEFTSQEALQNAVNAQPSFLSEKRRNRMANMRNDDDIQRAKDAGFNTLFMTIYPLQGYDWWTNPAAVGLIKDAIVRSRADF